MCSEVCNQQSILEKRKQANRAQFSQTPKTTENDRKRTIVATYNVSTQTGTRPNQRAGINPHSMASESYKNKFRLKEGLLSHIPARKGIGTPGKHRWYLPKQNDISSK